MAKPPQLPAIPEPTMPATADQRALRLAEAPARHDRHRLPTDSSALGVLGASAACVAVSTGAFLLLFTCFHVAFADTAGLDPESAYGRWRAFASVVRVIFGAFFAGALLSAARDTAGAALGLTLRDGSRRRALPPGHQDDDGDPSRALVRVEAPKAELALAEVPTASLRRVDPVGARGHFLGMGGIFSMAVAVATWAFLPAGAGPALDAFFGAGTLLSFLVAALTSGAASIALGLAQDSGNQALEKVWIRTPGDPRRPGDAVLVEVRATARRPVRLRAAHVEVIARVSTVELLRGKRPIDPDRRDRSFVTPDGQRLDPVDDHRSLVHRRFDAGVDLEPGESVQAHTLLRIPPDAPPPQGVHPRRLEDPPGVEWYLVVHFDLDWWPDARAVFAMKPRQLRSLQEVSGTAGADDADHSRDRGREATPPDPDLTWTRAGPTPAEASWSPACPYCGEHLDAGALVSCVACETLHHEDCFRAAGTCTTYGCGEERVRDAVLLG